MARRIAITGTSGLIGRHLARRLRSQGDRVLSLVRRPGELDDEVTWIPTTRLEPMDALEGLDALIHLAGAPVAQGRWTRARRRVLRDSRTATTAQLVSACGRLDRPPKVFIQAGATGYYGDRGDEVLDESSPPGEGFLAELAQAWERAGAPVAVHCRHCILRLGMVLSPDGGALGKMLPIFRKGLGGRIGRGRQWVPWIGIEDTVSIIDRVIEDDALQGPCNIVAPTPVPNAIFAQALGTALRRPTFMPTPAWALRMALGDMADALLLSSQRVTPGRLQALEHSFLHPTIDRALGALLAPPEA